MPNTSRHPTSPTGGQNTVAFSSLTTDRFRIRFDHQSGGKYSGVTEVQWS
ncbi:MULTISPECIES: hypothetical protein [unclassified Ktedonobacter]|nr:MULTISPECIES: hypothetical protein [unclassified Ktedonobacter]